MLTPAWTNLVLRGPTRLYTGQVLGEGPTLPVSWLPGLPRTAVARTASSWA